MALDPCVKDILCVLTAPVRAALQSVVTLVLVEAQTQLAATVASLATLELALLPVEIAKDAAQLVLDQFNVVNSLVPTNLISGCVDFGDLMQGMNGTAASATAEIDDFLQDATRLLSIKDELTGTVAALNKLIDDLNEFLIVFSTC